ncbi:S1 family peptidase [Nisaea sediminum]|uniref:S1 family peptidase n=1 Tax=Nisaea sediminum TaxID=2775867 RepID=UPI0018662933|nr:serine protease [Nisaea sediminum]
MKPFLPPDKLGLLGAAAALILGFLLSPDFRGSDAERTPRRPLPGVERPRPEVARERPTTEPPAPSVARPKPETAEPRAPSPVRPDPEPVAPSPVAPPPGVPPAPSVALPLPKPAVPPSAARLLQPPSDWDRAVRIDYTQRPRSSTGTAFAVGDGRWLTARHVVEGCDLLAFIDGRHMSEKVKPDRVQYPYADIAMVRAEQTRPPAVTLGSLPKVGDEGYHYGFPGVGKGRVVSTLLGRVRIRARSIQGVGRFALEWAEVRREGPGDGSLGGISGGPTLDASGRLVGIAIAGNPRRGRVTTVAPSTIRELLRDNGVVVRLEERGRWSSAPTFTELEHQGTVRQIYCHVGYHTK